MRNMIALPLLGLAVIVQSAIVSQFTLLSGYADLILVILAAWALQEGVSTAFHWAFLATVMLSLVSYLPWFVYLVGYFGVVLLALLLQQRVWQTPLLAMFSVIFLDTVFMHLLSFVYLYLSAANLPFRHSMRLITLPSVLLNILLAIPIYVLMRDLSHWAFPAPEAA